MVLLFCFFFLTEIESLKLDSNSSSRVRFDGSTGWKVVMKISTSNHVDDISASQYSIRITSTLCTLIKISAIYAKYYSREKFFRHEPNC